MRAVSRLHPPTWHADASTMRRETINGSGSKGPAPNLFRAQSFKRGRRRPQLERNLLELGIRPPASRSSNFVRLPPGLSRLRPGHCPLGPRLQWAMTHRRATVTRALARNPRLEPGPGWGWSPQWTPDSGKSGVAPGGGVSPISPVNRGWGWGWTPDPWQIGDRPGGWGWTRTPDCQCTTTSSSRRHAGHGVPSSYT